VKVHLVKVHASWKEEFGVLLPAVVGQAQLLFSKKGTRAISCLAKAI